MSQSIEGAIQRHIQQQSEESLRSLYQAPLSGRLLVPLFSELTTDAAGQTDLPLSCVQLPTGEKCIPAFTSVNRLLEWKNAGSKYTELPGGTLFDMATRMPEIDCIYINFSEQQGTPKGKVTRREFELLGRGRVPINE
jgi:hypothetical protein